MNSINPIKDSQNASVQRPSICIIKTAKVLSVVCMIGIGIFITGIGAALFTLIGTSAASNYIFIGGLIMAASGAVISGGSFLILYILKSKYPNSAEIRKGMFENCQMLKDGVKSFSSHSGGYSVRPKSPNPGADSM